jgi:hypothetical protein
MSDITEILNAVREELRLELKQTDKLLDERNILEAFDKSGVRAVVKFYQNKSTNLIKNTTAHNIPDFLNKCSYCDYPTGHAQSCLYNK